MMLEVPRRLSRDLFDQEFLDVDCNVTAVPFDPDTAVDDTVGTYATNYAIAAACIVFGAMLMNRRNPLVIFFIATGVGYGLAGLGHQISKRSDDQPILIAELVVATILLGSASLGHSAARVHRLPSCSDRLIAVATLAAFVAATLVLDNLILLGIGAILGPVLLFASILLTKEKPILAWGKVGTMVIVIAGYLIQPALAPICGSPKAYENCFRDCPLPLSFNHNALFHLVVLIGFVGFGILEMQSPLPRFSNVIIEKSHEAPEP